jgi:hypothetical protein
MLATISVVGAVLAGVLLGFLLFAGAPTTLEVDYSPSSSPSPSATEPAEPADG